MKTIKFSHNYPKLWGQETATLLEVRKISKPDNWNSELEIYDTWWAEGREVGWRSFNCDKCGLYPVPDGDLIQLIFLGNKNIPFCTIRTFNPEKWRYYAYSKGEEFNIEVAKE